MLLFMMLQSELHRFSNKLYKPYFTLDIKKFLSSCLSYR